MTKDYLKRSVYTEAGGWKCYCYPVTRGDKKRERRSARRKRKHWDRLEHINGEQR